MISTAGEISHQAGHWWCDQLNNRDGESGYHALGEETWQQTGRRVDAFVHAVSTAHSIHGTAHALRRRNPHVRVFAVEPAESAVLSGKPSGPHQIEGIGIGFIPPLWKATEVEEILTVSTAEAKSLARRLAREEGIFAGTSTGANVAAAIRVATRRGPEATVATIIVDSGLRYLSTDVFHRASVRSLRSADGSTCSTRPTSEPFSALTFPWRRCHHDGCDTSHDRLLVGT